MVASETFADFLREQLAPLGRVTLRRMFGKSGVFCDRVMFAMVTENTLYFRVDEENRATFSEAADFPPLNYAKQGSTIDLSFWRVPERCSTNPMNSSPGRRQHWRQRAGLRRSGSGRCRREKWGLDGNHAVVGRNGGLRLGSVTKHPPMRREII